MRWMNKMDRKIEYIIEEKLAIAFRKITGKISDVDFKGTYGLTEEEIKLIHEYYELVIMEDEE